MDVPAVLVNYEAFREGGRIIGHTNVTPPDIEYRKAAISGAGIAGTMDVPVVGQLENMESSIEFSVAHKDVRDLMTPNFHHIEFWGAIQGIDSATGEMKVWQHKIVMQMMPSGFKPGAWKPAEPQGRSHAFTVRYYKEMIDNETIIEIDKLNNKLNIGGQDVVAQIRAAIGV